MRVIVVGATGTLGRAVVRALEPAHEVVRASRRGPVRVDLGDVKSLDALFTAVPDPDAVVCCAASGPLVSLESVTDQEPHRRHLRGSAAGRVTGGPGQRRAGGLVRNAAAELPRGLRIEGTAQGRTIVL